MAQPHAYGPVLDTGLPPTKNPDPAATMDTKQQRTKSWAAMDANQARMQRPVLDTDQDRAPTTDTDQCRAATDTGPGRAPVIDMDQGPTPTLDTGQRSVTMDTDLRLVTHAPLGPRSLRQKVMRLRRRDARPCPRRLLVNNNQRAYTLTRS